MLKRVILEALLEKYEKSQVYKSQKEQLRRIMIKPSAFKKVNFEDYEQKSSFIDALESLKRDGVVDFDWLRFEKGNLVDKIWLNQEPDSIKRAYNLLGRVLTYDSYSTINERLKNTKFDYYPWMELFRLDLIRKFDQTGKFGQLLSSDQQQNNMIIECMIQLERLQGELVHERKFSIQVLGDSKAFQKQVKSKLVTLMNRYIEDFDGSDPMVYLGIMTHPELIYFCGSIALQLEFGTFDASGFDSGAVLPIQYVGSIRSIEMDDKMCRIVFIENRTTYEEALLHRTADLLIVYHGGFAGKLKQTFFRKLYESRPDLAFYHWSDMDIGGVRIFKTLKKSVPTIKPIFMDRETLDKYLDLTQPMALDYREKVKTALDSETDSQVHQMLLALYDYGVRLEQEAIDLKSWL